LITDDTSLNAPIRNAENEIVSAIELRMIRPAHELDLSNVAALQERAEMEAFAETYAGQYKIAAIGNFINLAALDAFSNPSNIVEILAGYNFNNIEDIRLVTLYPLPTDIIYIRNSGVEYAVPFSFDGCSELVDGELYSIVELIANL
jgi:hypothetical protein